MNTKGWKKIKVTIEIGLVLCSRAPPATTLNSRLLRISQFKDKFSYFTKKIEANHRIRTLFSVM